MGVRALLNAVDELFRSFAFESFARKKPGAVSERMLCLDLASLGRMTECGGTDAQKLRRFREIHPTMRFFIDGLIARDLVFAAQ